MLITVLLCALLVVTAYIPKEAIRDNTMASAGYLMQKDQFFYAAGQSEGSMIDRYADAILLNIAYHYDREYPLRSVLVSAYYFSPYQEENANLLDAVRDDPGPNQQYLRYWHGSILFIRPLLTVFSIRQIYILHGIWLSVLFLTFVIISLKLRQKILAVAMTLCLILTGSFFVPLSLEYTWNYLVMMIASLTALLIATGKKTEHLTAFFMICGMVTAFLDFLTTETLTLLIPLLIILWIDRTTLKEALKRSLSVSVCWVLGYIGMWAAKWGLTALVWHESVLPYVAGHVEERLGGDLANVGALTMLARAVPRNVSCLFPLGYGGAGVVAAVIIVLAGAYVAYVYHVRNADVQRILLFALVGAVPFVRFLVLHNHSYIHYFFTYRALGSTIFAIVLMIEVLIGEEERKQ